MLLLGVCVFKIQQANATRTLAQNRQFILSGLIRDAPLK